MAGQDDVQTVKDRLSIVDVVGQYVQLRRAGRNYSARCPFHKERTPSFHVSPERGTYMCFGCGEKGDIFSFVEKMEGIDFKTALQELAKKAGVTLHHEFTIKSEDKEKDARLYEVCEAAVLFYESQLATRADVGTYLTTRGVSDETKKTWRLGYAPAQWSALCEHLVALGFSKLEIIDAGLAIKSERNAATGAGEERIYDRFRGRVMFPIADAQGRIIAFSGRFFEKMQGSREEGEPAKYVNSPETTLFKKSRTLYGFHIAKTAIRRADCILLVEGQFDLILSHQSGLPFAVALSGTALTPEHLSLLGRLSKRLVLALDADEAGVRSGLRSALMAIRAGFNVKIPTFPSGKDPADVAKENPALLKAAVSTSKPAVEFFLQTLYKPGTIERSYKLSAQEQVVPLIAAMKNSIDQEHFVHVASSWLSTSTQTIMSEVEALKVIPADTTQTAEITPNNKISTQSELGSIEKKVAMLLFSFAPDSAEQERLRSIVGEEQLKTLEIRLKPNAEEWRFKFEAELGEHTSEETIATDMLADIARVVEKERFKMKFS